MHILNLNNHLEWALLLLPPCPAHQLNKIRLILRYIRHYNIDSSKLLYFAIVTSKIDSFGKLRSGACYATPFASTSNKILAKLPRNVLGDLIHVFLKGLYLLSIQYTVETGLGLKEDNDRACSLFYLLDVICQIRNILIFVVRMKTNDLLVRLLVRSLYVVYFFHCVVIF